MRTALSVALLALTIAGCGLRSADSIADSDRVLLSQFFAESRLRDLTALQKISTVVFEPNRDGIVTNFEITQVSAQGSGTEVLLSAPVKRPDGQIVQKNFLVTIQGGLVTAITERPALSPVEGPAPPSTPRP